GVDDLGLALARPRVQRDRRRDTQPLEHALESPESHAHSVLVPAPVRHVGQERLALRRRDHGARHRARHVPVFQRDHGPDDHAHAVGQPQRWAALDRREVETLLGDHREASSQCWCIAGRAYLGTREAVIVIAAESAIVLSSMDFALTADEQAFAAEVKRFLAEHPPERFAADGMDAGYGSGAHSRAFVRALAEQGWLSMTWPKAYGGRERPMFFKLVLMEELALAGAPFGPLPGSWQTADAIIEYGSERLRREV